MTARRLIAPLRLLRCGLHILHGVLLCALVFPFSTKSKRMSRVGRWSAQMLVALGVELRAAGRAESGAVLFVANHVSWLDILAINAVQPVRFVSKSDIRRWPLLGWLVACGGTLFIERHRPRDAIRVVHLMAEALRCGQPVAVFPEGTTSDGHGLLPFHANLLQAAISAGVTVQPIALRFADSLGPVSAAAAYVGDTTLWQTLWAVVSGVELIAHVTLLPIHSAPLPARRTLAAQIQREIGAALTAQL